MKKIVTFGEIMMRLNPAGYTRFVQAEGFDASYADMKDDGSHQWRMGYASEKECLTAACQSALSRVACAGKENAEDYLQGRL